mgnify:CR=1 FL=1
MCCWNDQFPQLYCGFSYWLSSGLIAGIVVLGLALITVPILLAVGVVVCVKRRSRKYLIQQAVDLVHVNSIESELDHPV